MNAARHRWFDEAKNARVHEHGLATSLVETVFVIVNFFEKYGRLHMADALDSRLLKKVFVDYARWYGKTSSRISSRSRNSSSA